MILLDTEMTHKYIGLSYRMDLDWEVVTRNDQGIGKMLDYAVIRFSVSWRL